MEWPKWENRASRLDRKERLVSRIYIVGAHSRSKTLGTYLRKIDPETEIEAYLVDNDEPNPDQIEGIPVIHFDEFTELNHEYAVYLGTRGVYHDVLTEKLNRMKMKKIIPVTPSLDMMLRNQYLKLYYQEKGRKLEKIDDYQIRHKSRIYVVKSIYDKPLKDQDAGAAFVTVLQVGAALTKERISELTDNDGDNISERNRQFCELTGLYWIWKHAEEDIIGLEHYRRHFLLPDDWRERMLDNDIDVILPTPLYVAPNVAQNYMERHIASDWIFMMEYVKEKDMKEYESMKAFFEGTGLYSPCNMFIMRRAVLHTLCEWMFPILFACAEHGGERMNSYQNRYPGFLAERLMTFFFEKNREQYKCVYADKSFLC